MIANRPLAARMRPTSLDQMVGQGHLVFPGSPLELLAAGTSRTSVLLYGPPGTGKTSIAQVIAQQTSQAFVELSATSAGVREVRAEIAAAEKRLDADGTGTVLFLDEIHRFSKAQQDILLPVVEKGLIALIGATTENPSFAVNSALVSRSVLMGLRPLDADDIVGLLERAIDAPEGLGGAVSADRETLGVIAELASGDTRQALGRLETCAETVLAAGAAEITPETVRQVTGAALQRYDRDGDQHYDVVSAFIKSMRGSDPDATLHWLARMIEAGEDPRFIARRLVVHASEDVGMADPSVLGIAVAAAQAVQLIGMPEARINLAQAAVAITTAPKSPAIIRGIDQALADVRRGRTGSVPMHLRDAHYPGAKALGHGAGYLYPHDHEHGVVAQQYLPAEVLGSQYYRPTANGFEQAVTDRLAGIRRITNETENQP
ncbi:replication-associated recombination protein A [Streptomyces sp. NPDC052042]|uniref:replication-associated recombination protein A n=1 Tax=Streptomyces sp. NPDC052042 TaxID=3365683 RepID=UPI0037CE80B4